MTSTFTDHPRFCHRDSLRFTYPDLLRVQEPVMATTSIEVHTLASRAGLPCPSCASTSSLVEVDVAFVRGDTLMTLGRVTASECAACGAADEVRC